MLLTLSLQCLLACQCSQIVLPLRSTAETHLISSDCVYTFAAYIV